MSSRRSVTAPWRSRRSRCGHAAHCAQRRSNGPHGGVLDLRSLERRLHRRDRDARTALSHGVRPETEGNSALPLNTRTRVRVAAPRTQPGGWPGGAELADLNAQSATRARRSARPVPTTRSTETRAHRGPGPRRALRALYRPPVPDAPIAELPDY